MSECPHGENVEGVDVKILIGRRATRFTMYISVKKELRTE